MRAIAYCMNQPVATSGFGTLRAYCALRGGDPECSTEFRAEAAAIATERGGLPNIESACNLLLRTGLRVPAVVSLESVSVARGRRIALALRAELSGLAGSCGRILFRWHLASHDIKFSPRAGNVLVYICALLGCGALVVPSMPLRGWVGLLAFGVMGVILVSDRATPHRRSRTMLGVYLLTSGVSFGLPKIWPRHLSWVAVIVDSVFFGAILAMVSALWFERSRRSAPAH